MQQERDTAKSNYIKTKNEASIILFLKTLRKSAFTNAMIQLVALSTGSSRWKQRF